VKVAGQAGQVGVNHRPMEDGQMTMSDRIATLALALSLMSSGFSVYQWWTNEQTEHVHATIDVSDKYISQWKNLHWLKSANELGQIGLEAPEHIRKQKALLEYIAYLSNKVNLDISYLSNLIICDIITTDDSSPKSEIAKFKTRHPEGECNLDGASE
jgi:hypothetical protein